LAKLRKDEGMGVTKKSTLLNMDEKETVLYSELLTRVRRHR
jgi:hypothetical protein